MKKIAIISALAFCLTALILPVAYYAVARSFVPNLSYAKWALFGGKYKDEYARPLYEDKFRGQLVEGKSIEQLKHWFPDMENIRSESDWAENELMKVIDPSWRAPERDKEIYRLSKNFDHCLYIVIKNGVAVGFTIMKG